VRELEVDERSEKKCVTEPMTKEGVGGGGSNRTIADRFYLDEGLPAIRKDKKSSPTSHRVKKGGERREKEEGRAISEQWE